MFSKTLAGALGAGIFALGAAGSAQAATFTVNTTANSGAGSLRSAINAANNTRGQGHDQVRLSPARPCARSRPPRSLPTITEPVKINGYTHDDGRPGDGHDAGDAQDRHRRGATSTTGLDVDADGVTRSTASTSSVPSTRACASRAATTPSPATTSAPASTARRPGPMTSRASGWRGDNNLVGGPDAADRNVIASNGFAEVLVERAPATRSRTTTSGPTWTARPTSETPGACSSSPRATRSRDNLISGENTGVEVAADDNVVQGNKIGTNAAGTAAVPNIVGVSVVGGDDNQIGGPGDGEGNLLSGNERDGVELNAVRHDRSGRAQQGRGQPGRHDRRGRRDAAQRRGRREPQRVRQQHDRRDRGRRGQRHLRQRRAPASSSWTPTTTRCSATGSAPTPPGRSTWATAAAAWTSSPATDNRVGDTRARSRRTRSPRTAGTA